MLTKSILSICLVASLVSAPLFAQNSIIIDPTDPLADLTSLGEWNNDDDPEGWTSTNLPLTVADGMISGTSETGDPQLVLSPIDPSLATGLVNRVMIEFRLQRQATDDSRIEVFWTDTAGVFSAGRVLTLPGTSIPSDGLPHTYRFIFENVANGLAALRVDGSALPNSTLSFDFLRVQILDFNPVLDPLTPLSNFTTLGEFDTDDDFETWIPTNIDPSSVADGNLSGSSSSNDPQLFRDNLNIDTSTGDFDTIEIRLRRDPSDNTRVDLFWGDDNGGIGAVRRTTLPGAAFPTDNQFHIIQFPIADLISGTLNSLRFDPSTLNGSPVNFDIDYIRIGSLPTSAPSAPLITAFNLDPLFGEIELTWTSIQGAPYRIESSPNLTPDSWTPAVSNLIGDAGTSTFLGPVNTTDQFFRVVLEN